MYFIIGEEWFETRNCNQKVLIIIFFLKINTCMINEMKMINPDDSPQHIY